MKLKTIIVEDEKLSMEALSMILQNYCDDDVEVIGKAANVDEAIRLIKQSHPTLLFLDIKLDAADNGAFEILNAIPNQNFTIIFTTGEKKSDKILKAVNDYGALKYLLKPLGIDDVINAVFAAKANQNMSEENNTLKDMNKTLAALQYKKLEHKIEIPIRGGTEYVSWDNIVMFRSDANICHVFLSDKRTIESTKSLKYFEFNLPGNEFQRVSRQHIVNLYHVGSILNSDGTTIYLSEKCTAPLSPKYSKEFYAALRRILGSGNN
ncbi:MAG: LytTR family DNA-binding domain-containing protein [Bacteroidales bacterium]|nr:LytTR family DNA-binding domain-containing protein [Bacteroidales bacterium]MCF8455869.1 LytTR family DNA-binding domain-containing protein [Bacteroidales bacterium]